LNNDIREVKTSTKVYTAADKTSNIYKTPKEEYNRLLTNAVTATYKKAKPKLATRINELGIKFAKNKGVEERMQINGTSDCFITLKDHKENFENNPKTRLINPAKNQIGRISKEILDNINKKLREHLQLNQWKNTKSVIEWFKNLKNKKQLKFVVFDIEQFYPSISQQLLTDAINFAKQHIQIKKIDVDTIMHARKSLLYKDGDPWMKKEGSIFDVTMGAYDGAEVCELVGIYLLSLLSSKCNKEDMGLYRDDGLAVLRNKSGPQSERTKKAFQKVFSDNGLKIEILCNLKIVNYLDTTLNLNDGTYRPYKKPNDETVYIDANSNHPPNIIKQLPISIETRLKNLSSNKEIFDNAAPHYQEALNKCGYRYILKFETDEGTNQVNRTRSRKRNVTWFNPPFSKSVSTNVAKYFLTLVDKHFPRNHKFKKLFNRNNLKVSYSCMRNMQSIVTSHNRKILNEKPQEEPERTCNCSRNATCPMNGNCLSENTIYSGKITSSLPNYGQKEYAGLSAPPWKGRFNTHTYSFNHRDAAKCEIANEVWRIKDLGGTFDIQWSILGHAAAYNPESNKCNLCLNEKLYINENVDRLLNTRKELVSKCRHMLKYALVKKAAAD
jgi:hypothetical protein